MKRVLALLVVTCAALLAVTGSASAACTPPYCPTPNATTGTAGNITATSATLNGTVYTQGASSGTYTFQLGTSAATLAPVGSGTVGDDNFRGSSVSANAAGLTPGTTYFFRVTISTAGGTRNGSIVSFQTANQAASGDQGGGNQGGNQGGGNQGNNEQGPVDPQDFTSAAIIGHRENPPFRYTFRGRLTPPSGVTRACSGRVQVQLKRGEMLLRQTTTRVRGNCRWRSQQLTAPRRELNRNGGLLRVVTRFLGNEKLNPMTAEIFTVSYGS